jgi:hypothetical protein
MTKIMKSVMAVVMASLAACSQGQSEMSDVDLYRSRAVENMKSASTWIIEEGSEVYSQKGKAGVFRKLLDEWSVQLWVDPWIESDTYIARFGIKSRGINYEIINLHRETLSGGIYEFWITKVDGADWSGESKRSMFYVTRTNDIFGRREILEANDQFVDNYSVDVGKVIYFPKDDPKILFDMEAWLYPDNYKDSDLKNIKVVMKRRGGFEMVRLGSNE